MATFNRNKDLNRLLDYLANNKHDTKPMNDDELSLSNDKQEKKRSQQTSIGRKKPNRKSIKSLNQQELSEHIGGILRKHHHQQQNQDCSTSEDDDDDEMMTNDNDLNERSIALAKRAKQTLSSSMFRYLNEYLYTHSSYEARKSFDREKFEKYHKAYEQVLEQWPLKPIDFIIEQLREKIKKRSVVIADIGCGSQAKIAEAFPHCQVYSFDLHSTNESIISADMCQLPLNDNQCDYAIYSLSLMSTNLSQIFCECNRILKQSNGYMIIVEIASRFADYGKNNVTNSNTNNSTKQKSNINDDYEIFSKQLNQHYGFRLIEYRHLPPNDYFVYFLFKKIKTISNNNKSMMINDNRITVRLKPCHYRQRKSLNE